MRRDDRVRLEEAPSLRLLDVHAADALSFPFGLALIVFCKERAFFPYTRAGVFALSAYYFLVSEAANGEDWINVRSRRSRLDTHRGGADSRARSGRKM